MNDTLRNASAELRQILDSAVDTGIIILNTTES